MRIRRAALARALALDAHALEAIALQLDAVRAKLEERGLAPGSANALRIFA